MRTKYIFQMLLMAFVSTMMALPVSAQRPIELPGTNTETVPTYTVGVGINQRQLIIAPKNVQKLSKVEVRTTTPKGTVIKTITPRKSKFSFLDVRNPVPVDKSTSEYYEDLLTTWGAMDKNTSKTIYEKIGLDTITSLSEAELLSKEYAKTHPTACLFGDLAQIIDPKYHILTRSEWKDLLDKGKRPLLSNVTSEVPLPALPPSIGKPIHSELDKPNFCSTFIFVISTIEIPVLDRFNNVTFKNENELIGVIVLPDDCVSLLQDLKKDFGNIEWQGENTLPQNTYYMTLNIGDFANDEKLNTLLSYQNKCAFFPSYRFMKWQTDKKGVTATSDIQVPRKTGVQNQENDQQDNGQLQLEYLLTQPDVVTIWTASGESNGKASMIVFFSRFENSQTGEILERLGHSFLTSPKTIPAAARAATYVDQQPKERTISSVGELFAESRVQNYFNNAVAENKTDFKVSSKIQSTNENLKDMPVNKKIDFIEKTIQKGELAGFERIPGKYVGTFDATESQMENLLLQIKDPIFETIGKGGAVNDLAFKNTIFYVTDSTLTNDPTAKNSLYRYSADGDTVYITLLAEQVSGSLDGFIFSGDVVLDDDLEEKFAGKQVVVSFIGSVTSDAHVRGVVNIDGLDYSNKMMNLHQIAPMQYGEGGTGIGDCKLAATFNEFDSKAGNLSEKEKPALKAFEYTENELKKSTRYFTLEEFEAGAASYWLNYTKPGYGGDYKPIWTVDDDGFPVKVKESGAKPLYGVEYIYDEADVDKVESAGFFGKEGKTITIKYKEKPAKVTLDGKPLKVGEDLTSSFQLKSNHKVEIKFNKSAEVDDPESTATALNAEKANKVTVTASNFKVEIGGVTAGAATVYDVAGNVVAHTTAKSINVPNRGIYIVCVDGKTYKVAVK